MIRTTAALALILSVPVSGTSRAAVTELDPVIVSATRSAQGSISIPAAVTVITRAEIEASGARHIADLLRMKAGTQVSDLFGDGTSVTVGLRGFFETANANTLVLVDGRRLNNPDISDPDFDSISLIDVEQIEIISGSAGSLFGDQAVGGVINVITRRPEKLALRAEAAAGSYGQRLVRGSVSDRLANGFAYRFSGESRKADNYREHNDMRARSISGRIDYLHDRGLLFIDFRHQDDRLSTPGALTATEAAADRRQSLPVYADDFFSTDTMTLRLGVQQALTDLWSLEMELTRRKSDGDFRQSFRTFKSQPAIQDRDVREFTPRLIGALDTPYGDALVTLGADLGRSEYFLSSQIGTQDNEQESRAIYAQGVFDVSPRTTLTVGMRKAWIENDIVTVNAFPPDFRDGTERDDSQFVKEIGVEFRPVPGWRMFARRDENFRFAKIDENTNTPAGVILRTQTGVSWEGGVEWRAGMHRAGVTAWRLDLEDEISSIPGAGAFGVPANINLAPTRRDGAIVSAHYQATQRTGLGLDYAYVDATFRSGPLAGNRVPFVATHTASLQAEYLPRPGLRLHGEAQAVSDRVFSGDFDKVLGELPGHVAVNAGMSYALRHWKLSAQVNNLLDREYSDSAVRFTDFSVFPSFENAAFYPAPERNFRLTARYEFD